MLMQNNSDMTRTHTNAFLQAYVRVHLTNVLIGTGSLKRILLYSRYYIYLLYLL